MSTKNKAAAKKATKASKNVAPVAPVNPKPETTTAPVVVAKVAVWRDEFGNRKGTRAHVINEVLFAADKPLTATEVENFALASELGKAYAKEEGKQVGAVRNHLQALLVAGLVIHDGKKWRVLTDAEKKARDKAKADAAKK